ncbi:MAG: type II and III secretion system protein family protein [Bryobacteraceae bacterium]
MRLLVSLVALAAMCLPGEAAAPSTPPPASVAVPAAKIPAANAAAAKPALQLHSSGTLTVAVNKSMVLERPEGLRRISIANGSIAAAAALSTTEVLLNGKSPGETTLLLWNTKGKISMYDVQVLASMAKIDTVRAQLRQEVGPDAALTVSGGSVFLRGKVADPAAADRAETIAATLGKVIDLLRVPVPPAAPQILLKVRFADVDRSAALQLGVNLFGSGAKGVGASTTGQFGGPPALDFSGAGGTVSDLLNIFYYRPDLGVGAVLQALQAKNLLQILAEPNLLTVSGRPASFLAGGEFPFPTLQGGGSGVGQITIQFKEFGIRLNFLPTITPRGTIRLVVSPEVSSLDYANGLTVNGFTVPGLDTRRVQTEVELANGQSFVIAGLLDNQTVENLNKIPGFSDIPILGKLFQSRSQTKSRSELLVVVTPEIVDPIPAGAKVPSIPMPESFLKKDAGFKPQNPVPDARHPAPPLPRRSWIPVQELKAGNSGAGPPPVAAGGAPGEAAIGIGPASTDMHP